MTALMWYTERRLRSYDESTWHLKGRWKSMTMFGPPAERIYEPAC